MGMRSAEGAQGTTPPMLRVAAAAQAVEAVGLCVAIVLNVIDSASGNDSTTSNAIGFIVVEAIVAIGVAWVASGLARDVLTAENLTATFGLPLQVERRDGRWYARA